MTDSFLKNVSDHSAHTWSDVLHLNGSAAEYAEAGTEVGLGLLALRFGAGRVIGAAEENSAIGLRAAPLMEQGLTAARPIDTLLADLKVNAAAANFADVNTYGLATLTDPTHIAQFSEYLGAERPAAAATQIFGAVDRGYVAQGTSELWLDQASRLELAAGTSRLDSAIADLEPFRQWKGFRSPETFAFTQFRSPDLISALARRIGSTRTGLENIAFGLDNGWNAPGTSSVWRSTLANLKGQL